MSDTNKCCQAKCSDPKKSVAALSKVILGLVFLVLGGMTVLKYWPELLVMIKAGAGLLLILIGVIILAIAKE